MRTDRLRYTLCLALSLTAACEKYDFTDEERKEVKTEVARPIAIGEGTASSPYTVEAMLIPYLDDGMIQIRVMSSFTMFESILNILLYAVAMILLPPLAEGLFFRKAAICPPNTGIMPFTVLIGLVLCAVSHALDWPGIIEMFLIALPVTLCYVFTRNIYISITAHFLFQLVTNVYYVGYAIARIITR